MNSTFILKKIIGIIRKTKAELSHENKFSQILPTEQIIISKIRQRTFIPKAMSSDSFSNNFLVFNARLENCVKLIK